MRRKIRLYRQYVSIVVRGMMQYKASFLLNSLGQFLVSFSVFLGIYFMFRRFHQVRGYSYSEVLLCYAIVLMEFSLAEMWARGFDTFSGLVRSGEFDRVLVRPQGEILQVLGSRFELTRLGRMSQAVVMLVYAFCTAEIHWTVGRVCTLLFMLVGGTAVFSGLFLIYAALCFFTLEGLEFMNVLTDGAREYGKYPLDVYGKRVLQFATVLVPYALIQYYPLQYILGRTANPIYIFLPLAAVLFLLPCYGLWRYGVRHYKSSGS
ncbi:MAG: ABC-2 family transporter protein [Acetatifactor sp.]|nr:ABC-2 family transporter protein [Acetatifactor sp.]